MQDLIQQNIQRMRSIIDEAKQHEADTAMLHQILRVEITKLHSAIQLPSTDSVEALCRFVEDYVNHVPEFVAAIHDLAEESGIEAQVEGVLSIATGFFLDPPQLLESHSGMMALMDEAYLAHRLIEEVNDRYISLCGQPLAPMDMTRSNLIVHHLIGEPFANELDSAVQYSVELIMARRNDLDNRALRDYMDEHRQRGWSQEMARWPCLAEDLAIKLNFTDNPGPLH